MSPGGENVFELISNAFWPAWSPDGTKIAYVSFGWPHDIYIVNAAGFNPLNLTNGAGSNGCPSWQPIKIIKKLNNDGPAKSTIDCQVTKMLYDTMSIAPLPAITHSLIPSLSEERG